MGGDGPLGRAGDKNPPMIGGRRRPRQGHRPSPDLGGIEGPARPHGTLDGPHGLPAGIARGRGGTGGKPRGAIKALASHMGDPMSTFGMI